ncbi:CDP-glycerol glycerophosphotransferase family protein [Curtobacterium sp. MCSS17_016]|uniref:bifunctional glycosyltransferase/CDP-glycerol:glycerophosphate glycerophosphotransferase n=1 Tax=Curtobacterium sp. MCSS17_016 TaxID=2175644 RepID=UPI000DA99B78|nr:CDP-glycerol glycerophosphotransferase family protein [Curtobacterium sp. MCSS17_016]WIE80442.1 CDP-glycerol glycerophosphotransferase family protein [Curtobacterium sp. MCSS17_016]
MPGKSDALITAIIPSYNVARYLPEFLGGLDEQVNGLEDVELVFVNDGSTDDTLSAIERWANGRDRVVVVDQQNAGLSNARNVGMSRASGTWVTFPDPDDKLAPTYFAEVVKFIRLHDRADLSLLGTHQIVWDEATGELNDTHPLRKKFEAGSRIADLHSEPLVHMSANSSFMRLDLIRELELTFDPEVRPNFEDGHFIARYLMLSNTHKLGLLASAKYHYRTRTDGSSLVQVSYLKPEKYTTLLEQGYLTLLELAERELGAVPRWLENVLLYELFWYYKNERKIRSITAAAPADALPRFHELVAAILQYISADAIREFNVMGVEFSIKRTFLEGYRSTDSMPDYVRVNEVDELRQETHLTYWFSGPNLPETFVVDDAEVSPLHAKTEDFEFYGRVTIRRRHIWLKRGLRTVVRVAGTTLSSVRHEQWGHTQAITIRDLAPIIHDERRRAAGRLGAPEETLSDRTRALSRRVRADVSKYLSKRAREDARTSRALHRRSTRDRFAHAWAFMDKDTHAGDNAEHLYRHVARHRPDINSWFILDRASPDWDRLAAEGFRLVPYRSAEWVSLLLSADHLASSHIDHYVIHPLEAWRYGKSHFKFTFLQHGITKDDLSRWLNIKPIDVFVTATPPEWQSIACDGPFSFTSRETVLTGFPRHDALLAKRADRSEEERDAIVFMPTWRQTLLGASIPGSNARAKGTNFATSEYAQQYGALLRSPRLRELATATGKKLIFMPHPNMKPHLDEFDVPDYVELRGYDDTDVQTVLARASLVLTDYSSLGFEASFLHVPVVYFQFDAAEFFNGMHIGRRGYFDYGRDGFGPVATDIEAALAAIEASAEQGWQLAEPYRARVLTTFTLRDGRSSERVIAAMEAVYGGERLPSPMDQIAVPDAPSLSRS